MQKVLLIGSSYSSSPILAELRKRDFHITVCGSHRSDPCHEYADNSHFIDYSNSDTLMDLLHSERFNYIVPSCNDFAYMSGAVVAEELGYPGFDSLDTANILHTKHAFRTFAQQSGIPSPKWLEATDSLQPESLPYPILVKPVDAFSGRGVSKVFDSKETLDAIALARKSSRTGKVIIEEFVQGNLHSHSAFLVEGNIVQDFFVDEFCTTYPYQVDCSNHPSFLSHSIRESVRKIITQISSDLSLNDGLIHTQFICNDENIWIIECMRRAPGDLFANMISYSTGINYTEMYVQPFIGESISAPSLSNPPKNIARHTISRDASETLFSFSHSLPSDTVSIVPLKCSGHVLGAAPYDKAAILFAEISSSDILRTITPSLKHYIHIKTIEDNYLA